MRRILTEEKLQKITTGRPHTASHLAYQTTRSHWIRKVNLNWPGHSLFNWANRMDKPRWGNCWYSRQINFHWIPVSPGDAKHTKEPPCCDTGRHILSCQSQFRVQSNEDNLVWCKLSTQFKCLENSPAFQFTSIINLFVREIFLLWILFATDTILYSLMA